MTTPPTNPQGETPRTDGILPMTDQIHWRIFCRQLERELAAVTKERDELAQDNRMLEHNCYMGEDDEKRDLRAQLAAARAEVERLTKEGKT